MELLGTVAKAWGFTGLVPRAIIDENAFGNLLVEDIEGRVWRICPEELSCKVVAASRSELVRLQTSAEFQEDWAMEGLVAVAARFVGSLSSDRCFCLKIPAGLGGAYERDNMGTISVVELIAASGDIAEQIKDLPPGTKVDLKVVE
jgi:hypothetical protein